MPPADDVESAREEFAETLDAIEGTFDLRRRGDDVARRVRSLVDEQPVPVAAIAVAGLAVTALAVVLVYRVARH